jgi:hypothetical protein
VLAHGKVKHTELRKIKTNVTLRRLETSLFRCGTVQKQKSSSLEGGRGKKEPKETTGIVVEVGCANAGTLAANQFKNS